MVGGDRFREVECSAEMPRGGTKSSTNSSCWRLCVSSNLFSRAERWRSHSVSELGLITVSMVEFVQLVTRDLSSAWRLSRLPLRDRNC
ncbi:hypothetical protein L249_0905 [Ophiocordyceps polyrhachis-furcata BCC 54312]|uniref:Uncharacterized protein n=1 Tax=Ophiocordyceps polyrhachis-furcata BCC 54312 TaxID=1330021 RepID=A0A367LD81_9HYPO|nr:hypothetical protein L249_0905 [Ophiocordyceps polyrhachis-furcata BCC 54312]